MINQSGKILFDKSFDQNSPKNGVYIQIDKNNAYDKNNLFLKSKLQTNLIQSMGNWADISNTQQLGYYSESRIRQQVFHKDSSFKQQQNSFDSLEKQRNRPMSNSNSAAYLDAMKALQFKIKNQQEKNGQNILYQEDINHKINFQLQTLEKRHSRLQDSSERQKQVFQDASKNQQDHMSQVTLQLRNLQTAHDQKVINLEDKIQDLTLDLKHTNGRSEQQSLKFNSQLQENRQENEQLQYDLIQVKGKSQLQVNEISNLKFQKLQLEKRIDDSSNENAQLLVNIEQMKSQYNTLSKDHGQLQKNLFRFVSYYPKKIKEMEQIIFDLNKQCIDNQQEISTLETNDTNGRRNFHLLLDEKESQIGILEDSIVAIRKQHQDHIEIAKQIEEQSIIQSRIMMQSIIQPFLKPVILQVPQTIIQPVIQSDDRRITVQSDDRGITEAAQHITIHAGSQSSETLHTLQSNTKSKSSSQKNLHQIEVETQKESMNKFKSCSSSFQKHWNQFQFDAEYEKIVKSIIAIELQIKQLDGQYEMILRDAQVINYQQKQLEQNSKRKIDLRQLLIGILNTIKSLNDQKYQLIISQKSLDKVG